jgi:multicomponent K+:H+ antiporter subunit E
VTWLLPFPIISAGLLALWLLLNQAFSVGHVLLGFATALVAGWALAALRPPKAHLRRPLAMFRLSFLVLTDIIRSNIAVGRIILGFGPKVRTSGFVNIPIALRDPYGLMVLACIITSTPGTLWVEFDPGKRILMIHVLDLIDENEWIRTIKGRYERLLLEIFE